MWRSARTSCRAAQTWRTSATTGSTSPGSTRWTAARRAQRRKGTRRRRRRRHLRHHHHRRRRLQGCASVWVTKSWSRWDEDSGRWPEWRGSTTASRVGRRGSWHRISSSCWRVVGVSEALVGGMAGWLTHCVTEHLAAGTCRGVRAGGSPGPGARRDGRGGGAWPPGGGALARAGAGGGASQGGAALGCVGERGVPVIYAGCL
jgi:hypothetical protein